MVAGRKVAAVLSWLMLFQFGPHSSLLLPFVVPGAVAAWWLLARGLGRGYAPDVLLALLLALPTLAVAQWLLGYAGWYDSHDWHSTLMFYVPWHAGLLLGPAYYLYFRSLTNQEFRWWPAGRHLLPGLLEVGLFAGAALYDLLYYHALRHRPLPAHFGTKGPAAEALDELATPLAWLGHALLLAYALRTLADYRRYRHYLNDNFSDPERLRFAGLRQLLALQLLVLALSLVFSGLNAVYDFSYDTAWYFFALRGVLIYGLVAVGLQANYAAASSPLRFGVAGPGEAAGLPLPAEPAATEPLPAPAVLVASATPLLAQPGQPPVRADAGLTDGPVAAAGLPAPATSGAPAPEAAAPGLSAELLPWRERLLALMEAERPWLEPELTLAELAQRLRTNPGLLSRVINTGCQQNFNDFVNGYRVAEARRRLADPRFAHYSLVGVALESGFNSKSTFNRVFRKLAGQAPGELPRPKP